MRTSKRQVYVRAAHITTSGRKDEQYQSRHYGLVALRTLQWLRIGKESRSSPKDVVKRGLHWFKGEDRENFESPDHLNHGGITGPWRPWFNFLPRVEEAQTACSAASAAALLSFGTANPQKPDFPSLKNLKSDKGWWPVTDGFLRAIGIAATSANMLQILFEFRSQGPQKPENRTRFGKFWPKKPEFRTRKWPILDLKNLKFRTTLWWSFPGPVSTIIAKSSPSSLLQEAWYLLALFQVSIAGYIMQ
ncbi:hypothetical protein B0H16DRAFT_1768390 [Mycena metata]|uniref:Uncharacterized protein n=1 Tax=Mycena metata TaxID=1033252 RepID=A0AAD7MUK3_9AGAR|nr:hypothetical protein B0H16DRAFT_1768390 [Mycena metata]